MAQRTERATTHHEDQRREDHRSDEPRHDQPQDTGRANAITANAITANLATRRRTRLGLTSRITSERSSSEWALPAQVLPAQALAREFTATRALAHPPRHKLTAGTSLTQRRPAAGKNGDVVMSAGMGASVISLVRTIEDEILPRLKLAIDQGNGVTSAAIRPTLEQVSELARLSIARDEAASRQYVEGLIETGMEIEIIYGDLLAPVARRLGEFWCDDVCDFADVTVGMIRLQKIQRVLSKNLRRSANGHIATAVSRLAHRRALIVPIPGEQHTFGASVVQDYFARAGWDVAGWLPTCEGELINMVRAEPYDMIGLTLSRDDKLKDLEACVALVRRASRNRNVVIAVGGPPFIDDPKRAELVGADATGATGLEAVAAVDAAISRRLGLVLAQ